MGITLPPQELSEEDLYPSSDGEPMAETEVHADEMVYVHTSLKLWLEDRADAHVSMNTFLYYRQGDPSAVVAPDHYVVFGSDKRLRNSYQVWREGGRLPSFVLEITSASTRKKDVTEKYGLYEQTLQVAEYFLFDPTGDYLEPRLQGFRLTEGRYVPIIAERKPLPNVARERQPEYWLYSEQLQLALSHEGLHLRFHDAVSGRPLLRASETAQAVREQAQRAEMEAQARVQAEAEVAQLRVELDALRQARGV